MHWTERREGGWANYRGWSRRGETGGAHFTKTVKRQTLGGEKIGKQEAVAGKRGRGQAVS